MVNASFHSVFIQQLEESIGENAEVITLIQQKENILDILLQATKIFLTQRPRVRIPLKPQNLFFGLISQMLLSNLKIAIQL